MTATNRDLRRMLAQQDGEMAKLQDECRTLAARARAAEKEADRLAKLLEARAETEAREERLASERLAELERALEQTDQVPKRNPDWYAALATVRGAVT